MRMFVSLGFSTPSTRLVSLRTALRRSRVGHSPTGPAALRPEALRPELCIDATQLIVYPQTGRNFTSRRQSSQQDCTSLPNTGVDKISVCATNHSLNTQFMLRASCSRKQLGTVAQASTRVYGSQWHRSIRPTYGRAKHPPIAHRPLTVALRSQESSSSPSNDAALGLARQLWTDPSTTLQIGRLS